MALVLTVDIFALSWASGVAVLLTSLSADVLQVTRRLQVVLFLPALNRNLGHVATLSLITPSSSLGKFNPTNKDTFVCHRLFVIPPISV